MTSVNLTCAPSSRRSRMLSVAAVSVLVLAAPASPVATAADNVWVGGASNGLFSDNANWQSTPSWTFGNSLKFNANTNATVLNADYGDWVSSNDIFFDPSFPVARTLQSTTNRGINFKLRLENQSSFTQTITMQLSGGRDSAGGIQLNPVLGSLILSGTLYNDDSVDYGVFGSTTATVTNLTLNTALGPNATQANVDFIVASGRNIAVQVNASQLWAGTTSVQSGSFTTGTGVTLASSAIVVAGGTVTTTSANTFADSATLTVTSGRLAIGGSDTVASLAGSGGALDLAAAATLTFGGSGTTSYAGAITGGGGLTKVGSGTVTLTGGNTYAGSTLVDVGTLRVNGLPSSSSVSVTAGATLAGTGTIGGPTTIVGTHSPGNSPGVQTFSSNLTYEAGSIITWELIANTTGSAGTDYDQIVIPTANLVYSGSSTLDLSFDSAGSSVDWANAFWNVNRAWLVLDLSAGTTTGFGNLAVGGSLLDSLGNTLSPTTRGSFSVAQSGQDVVLNFTAVPEPSACLLAVIGVGLAAVIRRRASPAA